MALRGKCLGRSKFILLLIAVLAYVEDGLLRSSTATINISLWFIIFKVVSAYSSASLSFGVPEKPYSLSGKFVYDDVEGENIVVSRIEMIR
jgi:hypothetical protein